MLARTNIQDLEKTYAISKQENLEFHIEGLGVRAPEPNHT